MNKQSEAVEMESVQRKTKKKNDAIKLERKRKFIKMWKNWLFDINKSEVDIAREIGLSQQAFNAKMRNTTIRYTELADIVEQHGYTIEITKKH